MSCSNPGSGDCMSFILCSNKLLEYVYVFLVQRPNKNNTLMILNISCDVWKLSGLPFNLANCNFHQCNRVKNTTNESKWNVINANSWNVWEVGCTSLWEWLPFYVYLLKK